MRFPERGDPKPAGGGLNWGAAMTADAARTRVAKTAKGILFLDEGEQERTAWFYSKRLESTRWVDDQRKNGQEGTTGHERTGRNGKASFLVDIIFLSSFYPQLMRSG